MNENEESFFVAISKLLVHNDTLYVFDRFGRDLLVSFDRNGNYITTFSQKGGGPKEYVQLWDFDVDSNYVYLYDRATKKCCTMTTLETLSKVTHLLLEEMLSLFYKIMNSYFP